MTAGCAGCEAGAGPYVPSPECSAAALVIAEREFADQAYFAVHRLTVAAYALQHPDSVREHSLAVHLGALHGAIELGLDVATNGRRIRRLSDVVAARSATEHCAVVRRWAAAVHRAWSPRTP